MLLDKHEDVRSGGKVAQFQKLVIGGIVYIRAAVRELAGIADHRIHGDAPAPFRPAGSTLNRTDHMIGRTLKNAVVAAHIRAQSGLCIQ